MLLAATALVLSATAPAYAQTPNINLMPELPSKTAEEKEQDRIRDKAYRDSLRKIPDANAASDPWGNVRGADAPRVAPKAASKAKSKSGPSAN
jgi:Lon protease-like protein